MLYFSFSVWPHFRLGSRRTIGIITEDGCARESSCYRERPRYTGGADDSCMPIALRIWVAVRWMYSRLSQRSFASPPYKPM